LFLFTVFGIITADRDVKIKNSCKKRFSAGRPYAPRLVALYKKWRYYGLQPEEYGKGMKRAFTDNLNSLRQANFMVSVLAVIFALFPFLIRKDLLKTFWYIITAVIALITGVIVNRKFALYKRGKAVSNRFVYAMITLFYLNVMCFGIYLGVFSNPDIPSVSFTGFIICALFLYIVPPQITLSYTLTATVVFIITSMLIKSSFNSSLDAVNALFAGCVSLFFGWKIIKFRLSLITAAGKFKDERDSYYRQSTVDELTQLKNRRDFTLTFQRFLTNYRQSDKYLCIAMLDIDFFKNYNDHYGHLMGDECLRAIGGTLRKLQESMSVYCARVGGEEFALLWFEKDNVENAKEIASRINKMVIDLNIPHAKSEAAPCVTVSIGVYITPCGASDDSDCLYNLADKALYAAKSGGRNRAVVTVAGEQADYE